MISAHTCASEVVAAGHWEDHGAWADTAGWVALATPVPVWDWGAEYSETPPGTLWSDPGGHLQKNARAVTSHDAGTLSWIPYWKTNNSGAERGESVTHTFTGLTVGRTYRFSTWAKKWGTDSSGNKVSLNWPTTHTDLTNSWQEVTRTYVATSTSLTVTITLVDTYDGAGDLGHIILDDMSLVATTEYVVTHVWVPNLVWVTQNIPLNVTEATVTMDEGWSPYVQAELTCAMPDGETMETIDPRNTLRVRISLHQRFGESDPLSAISETLVGIAPTVGSELFPNLSFDVNAADWFGQGATLARVTTPVQAGAGALRVTASSTGHTAGAMYAESYTPTETVAPGCTYRFSAYVRTAVTQRTVKVGALWYDRHGAPLSESLSGPITDTTTYQAITADLVAPDDAHYAFFEVGIWGIATNEIHYIDTVSLKPLCVHLSSLSSAWAGLHLHDLSAAYGQPYNAVGTLPSTHRVLNLGLRSRVTDHATGVMKLTLSSDEGLAQDYAPVDTEAHTPGSSDIRTICGWALQRIGAVLETDDSATGVIAEDASSWAPGVSLWDYLYPLVNSAGLRLWCDDSRRWHLTLPKEGTSGSLSLSSDQNVTQASQELSRDDRWADAIVVEYRWTDVDGLSYTAYDTAFVPGYSRVRTYTYDLPYPGPGAAAALLTRENSRGRVMDLSAVSDYGAAPGQTLTADVVGSPAQTGIVSSVSWSLPTDEMTVHSRELPA